MPCIYQRIKWRFILLNYFIKVWMSPETKLWIYLNICACYLENASLNALIWQSESWGSSITWRGRAPGAGWQRPANRDYIVTVINRFYLYTIHSHQSPAHSDTARDKFHWFPPADYVWTDCVAMVLSAVSCQATLQLSVWQIQIAQCPDSGTSLTQQSLVPASTGQCCIDA